MAFPIVESVSNNSDTQQASADLPAGAGSGDLLVFLAACRSLESTSQWLTPEGWTQVLGRIDGSEDVDVGMWYRIADGTEPPNQVFERSEAGSNACVASYFRISNADAVQPIDAVGESAATAAATAHPVGAVTPVSDDSLVVAAIGFQGTDGDPLTFPSPWVRQAQVTGGDAATGMALAWATQRLATAAAVPTFNVTSAVADGSITWSFAVRPLRNREPKVVSVATTTADNATSIAADMPASIVEGNLLLMLVGNESAFARLALTTGFGEVTGWNSFVLADDDNPRTAGDSTADAKLAVYWKFATDSEPAMVSVPWGEAAEDHWAVVYQLSGVDPTTPFNVQGEVALNGLGNPVPIPGAPTTRRDTLQVGVLSLDRETSDLTAVDTTSPGWFVDQRVETTGGVVTFNATGITLLRPQSAIAPAVDADVNFPEDIAGVGLQFAVNAAAAVAAPDVVLPDVNPAVVASTTGFSNSVAGATIELTIPSDVEPGDLLLAYLFSDEASPTGDSFEVPPGWIQSWQGQATAGSGAVALFYRLAKMFDPPTVLFTFSVATSTLSAVLVRVTGADPLAPVHALGTEFLDDATGQTTVTVPEVTTTLAGGLSIATLASPTQDAGPFFVQLGTGFTKSAEVEAGDTTFVIASKPLPAAGASGAVDLVASTAARSFARQVAIAPGPLVQARRPAQLLAHVLQFLPPEYESAQALLAGIAGVMAAVETDGDELYVRGTIGRSQGIWLTLQGAGLGVRRAPNETDVSLRQRIRNLGDRLTGPAILATAGDLFEPETNQPLAIIEWFEGPYLGIEPFFLDTAGAMLGDGKNSFILVVPEITNEFAEPVYDVVAAAIEVIRAAGVRWQMRLAFPVVLGLPNVLTLVAGKPTGLPFLVERGDITDSGDGMTGFNATNYGVVDIARGGSNPLRCYAFLFEWTSAAALSANQPFVGMSLTNDTGLVIQVLAVGRLNVIYREGAVARLNAVLNINLVPVLGTQFWVIVQVDSRNPANPDHVGGFSHVAPAGGPIDQTSALTLTAGVDVPFTSITAEQRLGLDAAGPNNAADQMRILEMREYDVDGTTFTMDAATALGIIDGSDDHTENMVLRYTGEQEVVV